MSTNKFQGVIAKLVAAANKIKAGVVKAGSESMAFSSKWKPTLRRLKPSPTLSCREPQALSLWESAFSKDWPPFLILEAPRQNKTYSMPDWILHSWPR